MRKWMMRVLRKRMMRVLSNSSLSRHKQKTGLTLPNLQQKNKIIKFDTNKIVLKSFIV